MINENNIALREFYSAYEKLLIDKNEDSFVSNISNVITKYSIVSTDEIVSIRHVISKLLANDFKFSYKMATLVYVKIYFYEKIIKILFPIFNFLEKNDVCAINSLANVLIITKNIRKCMSFINAFTHISIIIKNINDDNMIDTQSAKNKHINAENKWYNETKIEIIDRIKQMIDFFGLNAMKAYGVKQKHRDCIYDMNYRTLAQYYNGSVTEIKNYFNKYLCYCNVYMEIEKDYIRSIMSHNDNLQFGDIDILLDNDESSNDESSDDE